VYLEIRQNEFWGAQRLRQILFPLSLLILTATVFIFRHLILRNGEYKRRIEEQKSLVVLGTAASTLAHEIKNPLLSIRLQTSILERFCPPESRRELDIINAEVDRLSALSYRVNEYLRDPRGNACLVDLGEVFKTLSLRLLGRDVTLLRTPGPLIARIDPERLISVGENILRNALESGGDPEEIRVELGLEEGQIRIDILDRGPGIPEGDKNRVFDPFFTTKSRGTGIGLAVAKRFVEAAGGNIRIGDREGGGCAVTVCLSAQGGMGEGKS
jgi:two-component system sensor histidine kinase HydH